VFAHQVFHRANIFFAAATAGRKSAGGRQYGCA
jgi:hypothetical protein